MLPGCPATGNAESTSGGSPSGEPDRTPIRKERCRSFPVAAKGRLLDFGRVLPPGFEDLFLLGGDFSKF